MVAECNVDITCCAISSFVIGVDGDVVVNNCGRSASFMDRMSWRIDGESVSNSGDGGVVAVLLEEEDVVVVATPSGRVNSEGGGIELNLGFVDGTPSWRDTKSGNGAYGWMREECSDVFDG